MESAIPSETVHCPQCGGELHPDEGQIFLTCPYCGSAVYLDKSQVVFHWYLASTLDEEKARSALARWMAGNQTVKDLDQKAKLQGSSFQYFPLWYFKRQPARQQARQQANGKQEEILLQPAAATSVSELLNLRLPAGDLIKYDASLDSQAEMPSVPLQAALGWLQERQIKREEIVEQALVHVPLYTFKYNFQGNPYTAIVEGGTGGVFANIYPAKAEMPYRLVGCITALVFLCLATFPIIGIASGERNGLGIGLLACVGIGALAVPALFSAAAWVAAKI